MSATGKINHQPVLVKEAVAALAIKPGGAYIDGTYGRGGHSVAILDCLDDTGRLFAMDKDLQAVHAARARFEADARFSIEHGSFALMRVLSDRLDLTGKVNGILLDLGVSSPQLEDSRRGFSFNRNGPLDMRMDTSRGLTAASWLAQATEAEIADVLKVYGEERFAKRIARAVFQARRHNPIETTAQLAELIVTAAPTRERHKHPATRSFQAIRIFINRELEELGQALAHSLTVLAAYGRLAVISFHSLEDRIVKRFIRHHTRGEPYPRGLPVAQSHTAGMLRKLGKAIRPSVEECRRNPRAHSAVLRVAERMP